MSTVVEDIKRSKVTEKTVTDPVANKYRNSGFEVINYQLSEGKDSDKDIVFHLRRENVIKKILHEVKEDFLHLMTGNCAFECMCDDKLTGILGTKAYFWNHVIHFGTKKKCHGKKITQIKTSILVEKVKGYRIVQGGDGGRARMHLVPSEDFLSWPEVEVIEIVHGCDVPLVRHKKRNLK